MDNSAEYALGCCPDDDDFNSCTCRVVPKHALVRGGEVWEGTEQTGEDGCMMPVHRATWWSFFFFFFPFLLIYSTYIHGNSP